MYQRTLEKIIFQKLGSGKAIIVIGPRQVGKTTLIKEIIAQEEQFLFLDGDDPQVRNILSKPPNTAEIKRIIGQHKVVFIDEAQRIDHIGLSMKIITDQLKDVQLLASGSSAFELNQSINEPLTGRKWQYRLFPISWEEFENKVGYLESEQQLEERLVYGFYPDVLNYQGEEKDILRQLTDSYLYKDVLMLSDIKKPKVLESLLQALAYQVGSEVSYNELSRHIGIDKNTVAKYIDVLCEAFVIFRLGSFSRNLRNEIKSNQKIYFYDNGIRNAIIGNFRSLNQRDDIGALWENFLIAERIKYNAYYEPFSKIYFWRTTKQQEVDLVEEKEGEITGFEFKWNPKKAVRLPKTFVENYQAKSVVITKDNFREFVMRGDILSEKIKKEGGL